MKERGHDTWSRGRKGYYLYPFCICSYTYMCILMQRHPSLWAYLSHRLLQEQEPRLVLSKCKFSAQFCQNLTLDKIGSNVQLITLFEKKSAV